MKNKGKYILGCVTGFVLGSITIVCASEAIRAIQNTDIKVRLNGRIQELTDETTGETQYPITYNNRTYLPLRSVAKLSGLEIDFDNDSNTIFLNEKDNQNQIDKDNDETIENPTKKKTETKTETISRFMKEHNKLNPDYMITQVYWNYTDYIKFYRDGLFVDVYFENDRIKAVITENTYFDREDETLKDASKKIPTHFGDVMYNMARVGNEDISKKKVEQVFNDLKEKKYGSALMSNVVEIDGVTFTYYNQADFFSATIEMDFESIKN